MTRFTIFALPAFLALCFGAVYTARLLPAVVGEPMKIALGLSDTQLGLLTGLVFGLAYGVCVLPLARYADRSDRRRLVAIALLVAAGATFAGGIAASFAMLVVARIMVSMAEAAVFPATVSMVADRFDEAERARAMAIYTAGIVFGLTAILWAVGQVSGLGWRSAYYLTAGVLVVAAILVFVVVPKSEPRTADGQGRSIWAVLADLRRKRAFLHLAAAMTLYLLVDNAALAWTASFVERTHGFATADAVGVIALGSGLLNGLAVLLSSPMLAAVRRRGADASLLLLSAVLGLSTLCYTVGYALPTRFASLVALILALGLSGVLTALLLAAVQDLAEEDERTTAAALVLTPGVLFGAGGGPQIVGIVSDQLTPVAGANALATSLTAICAIAGVWAALHAVAARRTIVADLATTAPALR